MERFFSTDMPSLNFLRNVLLFSLAGLLPVLALYVLLSPGFASALAEGGPALGRFLRQVLTNGLPVVVIVNYVGFFLFAHSRRGPGNDRDPATYIIVDFAARIALFFGLHALIYVLSADWFGSFGGSRATALRVVAPTLARSALFENISGVYLYATLVSALPLYVSAITRSPSLRRIVGVFPNQTGPIAVALLVFLVAAACLTALASAFVRLQN
ncbi:MAG: hypothetical protein HKN02_00740 [Rhodobacteraceae bacterium]|nr:hypothetical protein [Paracoccaceae bacterium]